MTEEKKRGRSRKTELDTTQGMTMERRRYLLELEPPSLAEAQESGLPHICITCSHCKIVRHCYESERIAGRTEKGSSIKEPYIATSVSYLCGQQFNALQDWAVLTCEMYTPMPEA